MGYKVSDAESRSAASLLTPNVVAKLVDFVGYGPLRPEVVFLGIEEAGGGVTNILARAEYFERIEDLYVAHEKLERHASVANPFKNAGDPVQQWNTAAFFSLALAGADVGLWPKFWRNFLGRRNGQTFLMERFPVPRSSRSFRVPGYRPNDLWRKRRPVLKSFLDEARPPFLVAYGDPAHEAVLEMFTVDSWVPVIGTPWHVGKSTTGVVISRVGFFGQGRFNKAHIPAVVSAMHQLAGARANLEVPSP